MLALWSLEGVQSLYMSEPPELGHELGYHPGGAHVRERYARSGQNHSPGRTRAPPVRERDSPRSQPTRQRPERGTRGTFGCREVDAR
ncbi:hypothetical protein M707_25990 [Arthrobacter sp. AK-YN10]|nr:hypothetical protein M707_25990 [Arthrobacter sp. AK-YN10]